jgi:adenine/guanine/hypoxanthine permease
MADGQAHSESAGESISNDLLVGLTLLLSISYAPITIAGLLTSSGMPHHVALCASIVSIAIGCLLSALLTRTPFVIAPAVGMAALLQASTTPSFSWQQGLLSFAAAGVAALVLSLMGDKRRAVLDSLPEEIRLGISGGVGAILVTSAWDQVKATSALSEAQKPYMILTFGLALLILLFGNAVAERLNNQNDGSVWYRAKLSASQAIPILVVISVGLLWSSALDQPAESGNLEILTGTQILEGIPRTREAAFSFFLLGLVALFVLLTDIPGTPYELSDPEAPDFEKKVRASFKVDSIMAILNCVIGTVPSIYYVENNATRHFRPARPLSAIVVGLAFAALAWLFFSSPTSAGSLLKAIPPISLAPLLAFIGLTVIARSMLSKRETLGAGEMGASVGERHGYNYYFYMPAAVMIILTPVISLQFSLPTGVCIYWLYRLADPRGKPTSEAFIVVSFFALIAVILRLILFIF